MLDENDCDCFNVLGGTMGDRGLSYIKTLKYFWISVIVAEAWCGIWILAWLYTSLPASDKYIYALSDFSIVFSLFFYEYLRRAWQNYTSGADMYYRMMYKVTELSMSIFSSIEYIDSGGKVMIGDTHAEVIDNIKHELKAILYHISLTFMPHKLRRLKKPKKGKSIGHEAGAKGCLESMYHIASWISDLETYKCIKTGGINAINARFADLQKSVEDIESSQNVGALDSIDWYITMVIGIYFVVVVPYKIVTSVSYMIFLLYPFLIFAMMGTFLIRKYAGSPFNKASDGRSDPLDDWYTDLQARIDFFYGLFLLKIAETRGLSIEDKEAILATFSVDMKVVSGWTNTSFSAGKYSVMEFPHGMHWAMNQRDLSNI